MIRGALSGFTRLYADRYGKSGIRMNNLLPGYLSNWEWPESLLKDIPAGRAGTVDEVGPGCRFFALYGCCLCHWSKYYGGWRLYAQDMIGAGGKGGVNSDPIEIRASVNLP